MADLKYGILILSTTQVHSRHFLKIHYTVQFGVCEMSNLGSERFDDNVEFLAAITPLFSVFQKLL